MAVALVGIGGCITFQSIAVMPPKKTVFGQGEAFSYEGLQVTGTTKKGETKDISGDRKLRVSGYDPSQTGEQTITVDYKGVTTTYTVTVAGLEGITIDAAPGAARQGLDIDRSALRFSASYGDKLPGRTVRGHEVKISGYNRDSPGSQTVTAEYYGKTTTFTVNVAPLTGIRVTKPPTKISYLSGEPLDLTGIEASASWQGAGEAPVKPAYVSGFDTTVQGKKTVVVAALGKQASFTVTVKEPAVPDKWTPAQAGFAENVTGIAYGNGVFVAAGYYDAPHQSVIAYSADGVTWTQTYSPHNLKIDKVFFGGGKFTVCGTSGDKRTNYLTVSQDGIKWGNLELVDSFGLEGTCTGMAWGNDMLVAVFDSGMISGSRRSMKIRMAGSQFVDAWNSLRGVFFNGSRFIAFDGTGRYIYLNKGSSTWEPGEGSVSINGRPVNEVAAGNGKFIAVGPRNALGWSINGLVWTDADSKGEELRGGDFNGVAYGFGMFVAVNSRGNIIYSRDGYTWTKVASSTFGSVNIRDVAYGNGKFVAIGDNGRLAYSNKID
jgi:hypothetical protein